MFVVNCVVNSFLYVFGMKIRSMLNISKHTERRIKAIPKNIFVLKLPLILFINFVPHSPHGHDEILSELFSDSHDMIVHSFIVAYEVVAPYDAE